MLKNKKISLKIATLTIFALFIFSNIFTINSVILASSDNLNNENPEIPIDDEDSEIPIYDKDSNNPNYDRRTEPLGIIDEENIQPIYNRSAIEWRPIEETLKNVQINNEAEIGTIATASYDALTGIETISTPQFIPTPEISSETSPELLVVEPYAGLLSGTNGGAESVIGGDGRVIVNNNVYPYRTTVKLYISDPWGGTWVGSGAIIDNFHVLTAGHCAYIRDDDNSNYGWAVSIEVVPGMDTADNPSDPYGHAWVVGMRSYTGWTVSGSASHDWAVLTLDRNIGAITGWMGRSTAGSGSSIYDGIMNVAGYPTDLSGGNRMYWDSDLGDGATANKHFYWADTASGMSGGPVWRYVSGNRYIMTVHAYGREGTDSNFGTRLNNDKYNRIFTWLGDDSAPTDKPDLEDRGPAYSTISSNGVTAGVDTLTVTSHVRNVGTAALTSGFYVHYYASTNTYISTSDYLLGSDYIPLSGGSPLNPFASASASWSNIVPASIPAGNYYIGWIIDKDNNIDEFDETNNAAYESLISISGAPPPSGYIEVTVRDSDTLDLIPSAYVRTYESGTNNLIDSGFTDVNGFYTVTELDIGWFDIIVSKPGYYNMEKFNYINWIGDDDYLLFLLNPMPPDSGYIEVNVKDSDTLSAISSAYVQTVNMSSGLVIDSGWTDGSGFYNVTGLFIGWYEVTVSRPSYKTQSIQDYINWNGDDDYLYFLLEEMPFNSGYIEVRTFNETGGIKEGVTVKTYNASGLIDTGVTDATGFYNITGLVIGWYEVNVTYLAYQEQSQSDYINWNGDDDYLTFWIVPNPPDSGYIEVNVYDSITNLSISNALVEVINQSSGLLIQTGYTDPSGWYTIVNLTIGWYTVNVSKEGYIAQSKTENINWAGDDDYLSFYLIPRPYDSGYIEVLVKTMTDLPLINANVSCYYLNGTLFKSGLTNSSGLYNITGLYIGWYEIIVTHTDYGGNSQFNSIDWYGDDDSLTFYLDLKPPGWIELNVYDIYYNPIPSAYVRCFNTTSGELFDEGYTDSSGFYNITGLLLGWWTVNVSHPSFVMQSQLDYINWRGDQDYLTFYLDTKFVLFTGNIALFRDISPWNLNVTEPILIENNLPYTVYNSLDFGNVDLSSFKKVVIVSDQYTSFYDRLKGNESWFQTYVANGGILVFLAADYGWHAGAWDDKIIFGLNHTVAYKEFVNIVAQTHPLLLSPTMIEDDELDNWFYSTHGYFESFPSNTDNILLENSTQKPVLVEFKYGLGFILATVQPLEWNHNLNFTKILENLILYDPSYYDNSLIVTSPFSISSWEVGSTQTISWSSTGSITNVKIDLYENSIFVMEIIGSTPNDGSYSWAVSPGHFDSTLYQVKISNAEYGLTYDYSSGFEIFDLRSINVTSPISSSSWIIGSTYNINWTSTGIIPNIKIDLYASGSLFREITNSTPNTGSFSWLINGTFGNFTDFIIRVSHVIDPSMYDDSAVFQITTSSGGIPGYDLLILGVMIIGISIIYTKKKLKKTDISKR